MREVARFATAGEAQVAASFLAAHGVHAFVADLGMLTVKPILEMALGGVRILAPASDVETARQLLADVRMRPPHRQGAETRPLWLADGLFRLVTGLAVLLVGNGYPGTAFRRSGGRLDKVQVVGVVLLSLSLLIAVAAIVHGRG